MRKISIIQSFCKYTILGSYSCNLRNLTRALAYNTRSPSETEPIIDISTDEYREYLTCVVNSAKNRPTSTIEGSLSDIPFVRDVEPLAPHMRVSCVQHIESRDAPDFNREEASVDESWVEILLPLSSDSTLAAAWSDQDSSDSNWSRVRFAKFYALMDALTGDVALRHALKKLENVTVVTACHYNSLKLKPTLPYTDIVLRSYPVDVGHSSIQVRTDVWQNNELLHFIHTVMVAVDRDTMKPVAGIPKLVIGNDEDAKARLKLAQKHRNEIRRNKENELTIKPPSPAEIDLVHHLLMEANSANKNVEMSKQWSFTNYYVVFPEQRNSNGKMFGGWVSCEAYNLAYFTARAFTGQTPIQLGADEMLFHLPVSVGDVLRFTSRVVLTTETTIRIWVVVETFDPRNIQSRDVVRTNHLKFIFRQPHDNVRSVKPEKYNEILYYLEAKRFYDYKGF